MAVIWGILYWGIVPVGILNDLDEISIYGSQIWMNVEHNGRKKSITGNWKSNTGSSMLEQIAMTDRYRFWVDEVAKLFGGLDMCTVQAIVEASSGKEYIIDASDC